MKETNKSHSKNPARKKTITIISLVLAFVVAFFGGYFSHYLFDNKSITVSRDIIRILQSVSYVIDPATGELKEITYEDIADSIVDGLNDNYAEYYTKEEYEQVRANSKGDRKDYGISFYSDTLLIGKVLGNSPAGRVGILSGDVITEAKIEDGEWRQINSLLDFSPFIEEVLDNQTISIKVLRQGETLTFSMKAEEYTASYVTYYDSEIKFYFESNSGESQLTEKTDVSKGLSELSSDTALISLGAFEGDAYSQLKRAIEFMVERGRSKLIFDLRNNGGGSMNVLTDVASLLVYNNGERKTLVATAEWKNKKENFYYKGNNFNSGISDIAVIANERTASASECLIGAMLHYGDHLTMEKLIVTKNSSETAKTFGKGIMQTTYILLSGGALKLTTARVLWPDQTTCIHGVGIRPLEDNAVADNLAIARAQQTLNG